MQITLSLKLLPSEAYDNDKINNRIAEESGKNRNDISGFIILKRSIDARGTTVWVNLTLNAYISEPFFQRALMPFDFHDVTSASKQVIIIGAGPAGLAAALFLLEQGVRPVILERGKDVKARRRDLAILNKEGVINPESNYCFGEGGAGTYSDGKLYTRSNKRGNIERILNLFVHFGAEQNILYDAHPHIGTNKLPQIITAMRSLISTSGGKLLFEKKVTDLVLKDDKIMAVQTADGQEFSGDAYILATGHSARDIFALLHEKKIKIEARPFALGVRIEHPQLLIDQIQYHCESRDTNLPPAAYSLVKQVDGKGVFSFCMCPGGIIAPASTSLNELVVNGWSPSKRNNPFANSGIVVQVELADALLHMKSGWDKTQQSKLPINELIDPESPLLMMYFQQMVEMQAFNVGGGKFQAPAQRMIDFTLGKTSASLPASSYIPGIKSSDLGEVLPKFISERLNFAFKSFGKNMKGYLTNEAVIVAPESRTSSPVRIPRDPTFLNHPHLSNFYPCGEGAGYAGGIVSAAMDGERVANSIILKFKNEN